jgi:hypothetical protein
VAWTARDGDLGSHDLGSRDHGSREAGESRLRLFVERCPISFKIETVDP